ncbi:MAG: choice-of-anchor D domain-containing protein [Deltaproteobacteria bacterium]|nr:choice-of-anchor D domain-containing protein [Deltaproteobacteria bacterium]
MVGVSTCLKGGVPGTCRLSDRSPRYWCAYPDGTCGSGERWGIAAGDGVADECRGGSSDGGLDGGELSLTFDPTTHDFGPLAPGAQSAPRSFVLKNRTGTPLAAVAITLEGSGKDAFALVEDNCNGADLPDQMDCSLKVSFRPISSGVMQASLNANVGGQHADSALTGTGVIPARLEAAPTEHDVGMVVQGMSSGEYLFTLTNRGDATTGALTTALVGADASQFTKTVDECAGSSLAGGATCSIRGRFSPTSVGDKTAGIEVMAAPGGSLTLGLRGRGLQAGTLGVDRTMLSFGVRPIGTMSPDETFVFSNSGAAATGTVAVSLNNLPDFDLVSNGCAGTIGAGASCMIRVRFAPDTVGSKIASLTVSATPGGNAVVSLTGSGTARLTVAKTGNGTGRVTSNPAGIDCGGTCMFDSTSASVRLTAMPSAGSTWIGWSGAGCSGVGNCDVAMDAAKTVTAEFSDTTAPTVMATNPTASALNVEPSGAISVTFSEDIDPTTATTASVVVRRGGVALLGTVATSAGMVTFTPTGPMPLLGHLTVTVSTMIKDLAGNSLVSPYVWSFDVRDGIWGGATVLSSSTSEFATSTVSANAAGVIGLVWVANDGTRGNVMGARYARGSGWSSATPLESANQDADSPRVAVDGMGNVFALWRQQDATGRYSIYASRFAAGSGWSASPTLVETVNGTHASAPSVVADNAGNATAAWAFDDAAGGDRSVYANRYVAGAGWGTAAPIENYPANRPAQAVMLAGTGGGKAIAVFQVFDGTFERIHASTYLPGTGWDTGGFIENEGSNQEMNGFGGAMAMNASGDGLIVWGNGASEVRAVRIQNGIGLTPGGRLASTFSPAVCVDGAANAIVTASGTGAVAARHTLAGAFAPLDILGASTSATPVVCDTDGNAIAVVSNPNILRAHRFRASTLMWGTTPTTIDNMTGVVPVLSTVAIDGSGVVTAVWGQFDGTRYNLYFNRFE